MQTTVANRKSGKWKTYRSSSQLGDNGAFMATNKMQCLLSHEVSVKSGEEDSRGTERKGIELV